MGLILNRRKLITAVGAAPFAAWAVRAPAMALEVDVSGGKINPLPIAIAPFLAGSGLKTSRPRWQA